MAISLKIKGNKRANDGIGFDLLAIGDRQFTIDDNQYIGAGGVTDFIVVRHLPDKSIFTFVTKNVVPSDSTRQGSLFISVSIPVGEQVEDLFHLLLELSDYYKANYMVYDGQNFKFTQREETAAGFEEIMSRYPVVKYPYKPIAMSPDINAIAYVFMTPEQIEQVLRDSMRPEFASFGQVVLVPVSDPSAKSSTISIPARIWRSYRIFVNGRDTNQTVADPHKVVKIAIPENATYEAALVKFTIEEARNGLVAGVVVDDFAQIIYVKIEQKKKPEVELAEVEEMKPKNSSRKTIIIVFGTIGVIIGLLLGGWMGGFFKKKPAKNNDRDIKLPEVEETISDQKTDSIPNEIFNPDGAFTDEEVVDETETNIDDIVVLNETALRCLKQMQDLNFEKIELEAFRKIADDENLEPQLRDKMVRCIQFLDDTFAAFAASSDKEYAEQLLSIADHCQMIMPKLSEALRSRVSNKENISARHEEDRRATIIR